MAHGEIAENIRHVGTQGLRYECTGPLRVETVRRTWHNVITAKNTPVHAFQFDRLLIALSHSCNSASDEPSLAAAAASDIPC